MPSRQQLKDLAFSEVDSRADEIVQISKTILSHPETGFRELKTSSLVARTLRELGVPTREGIALTGVKGRAAGRGGGLARLWPLWASSTL